MFSLKDYSPIFQVKKLTSMGLLVGELSVAPFGFFYGTKLDVSHLRSWVQSSRSGLFS